ncbi:MAG: type I-B CRISPR-associated protein Cas7/Cst2/DevR [Candidatus Brocadiaceae bacterium]|nr:type I-B CRISPR-associated protein Cas7/Cst2/DevR [Candidatus Brocadiaceae bacterium]
MNKVLTNIAGTFLIQADASFLNGAGLGEGEDRNVTIPKTFQDGKDRVPYVSSQAWKRWLRNTCLEENSNWPKSELKAIGLSEKGTANKISGELNPVECPEDDIFGYMKAEKGQGKTKNEVDESEDSEELSQDKKSKKNKTKSVMRTSPFAASLLVSIRKSGWRGRDEGFVHLQEGTPLPYTTEFYNAHMQGVFSLCYERLGVFSNLGDRIELEEEKVEKFIRSNNLKIVNDMGELGKVYEVEPNSRKDRASALLKALAVLRGGAKQAQFGTDVSPKVLILAGLNCGNPIFNHIFNDAKEGPEIKIDTLKEIIKDYSDRLVTPVYLGIRKGYLKNEEDVNALNNTQENNVKIIVNTPIDAAQKMAGELQ